MPLSVWQAPNWLNDGRKCCHIFSDRFQGNSVAILIRKSETRISSQSHFARVQKYLSLFSLINCHFILLRRYVSEQIFVLHWSWIDIYVFWVFEVFLNGGALIWRRKTACYCSLIRLRQKRTFPQYFPQKITFLCHYGMQKEVRQIHKHGSQPLPPYLMHSPVL